jgi:hypothetical protein
MKIRPEGAELCFEDRHTDERTDGQTDGNEEVNSCFSQFCYSAYKWNKFFKHFTKLTL